MWKNATGFNLASKIPKSQSNWEFIGCERSLGRGPQLFTRQSPKDPLPMCQAPEDTLEGHLSMYCQVRAVLVVEKERGKKYNKVSQISQVPPLDLVGKHDRSLWSLWTFFLHLCSAFVLICESVLRTAKHMLKSTPHKNIEHKCKYQWLVISLLQCITKTVWK